MISPHEAYQQTQLRVVTEIEGKYDAGASRSALACALGLSGVELSVAFFLLMPAGWLIAAVGACFPVCLLWAMANYHADRVEIPKEYDQLIDQYEDIYHV